MDAKMYNFTIVQLALLSKYTTNSLIYSLFIHRLPNPYELRLYDIDTFEQEETVLEADTQAWREILEILNVGGGLVGFLQSDEAASVWGSLLRRDYEYITDYRMRPPDRTGLTSMETYIRYMQTELLRELSGLYPSSTLNTGPEIIQQLNAENFINRFEQINKYLPCYQTILQSLCNHPFVRTDSNQEEHVMFHYMNELDRWPATNGMIALIHYSSNQNDNNTTRTVDLVDSNGRTLLDRMLERPHVHIVKILLSYGAKLRPDAISHLEERLKTSAEHQIPVIKRTLRIIKNHLLEDLIGDIKHAASENSSESTQTPVTLLRNTLENRAIESSIASKSVEDDRLPRSAF
jgi:hypothetical protein